MTTQTNPVRLIEELEAHLNAAKAAVQAEKAEKLEPYVREMLKRRPIARSKKEATKWVGAHEIVTLDLEGRRLRVAVNVTDVERTAELKKLTDHTG